MTDPVKRYYGLYRGVVKDNKDPDKQRKLKVSVPQTTGNEITGWAWPVEPSSIHTEIPVLGQGVWVVYIGGDPDFPVWIGSYGKNLGKNKLVYIKSLPNTEALTGITDQVILLPNSDGTKEVDLVATILAMANKIKVQRTDYTALALRVTNLEGAMAGKAAIGHTHT